MANDKPSDSDKQKEARNITLRRVMSSSYAFVKGVELSQTFSSLTPEDCIDEHIRLIEGARYDGRLNKLGELDKIKNDLLAAVEQIKAIPPEEFLEAKPDQDVNPPKDYKTIDDDLF